MTYKTNKTNMTYKTYMSYIVLFVLLTAFFSVPQRAAAGLISKAPNNLGLVGYWSLDEGAGYIVGDMSGNGNTAAFYGSPAWVNGKRGKALNFNGSTPDYLKTSGTLGAPTTVTVSAWMKADDTASGGYRYVAGQGRDNYCSGYSIRFYNGNIYFDVNTNSANDGCEASPNTPYTDTTNWHHVVGVYDQTTAYIYIDGVLRNSVASTISGPIVYKYSEVLNIGKMSYGEPTLYFPFDGLIDDVRIYSRALSATEVANLYRSGQVTRKAVSERDLVGYWPFNEGRGAVAGDSSGRGNNATLAGTAPPTWTDAKRSKGVNYAGGDAYLTHGTTGISSTSGTVAAWIYPTAAQWGFWQTHDSSSQNWVDWISMFNYWGGTFYFRMGNGSDCCSNDLTFTTSTYIPQNQWSHDTFTWSGTADSIANDTMTVYVNGVAIASRSNASFQATVDSAARIGYGHGIPFTGKYDDLRIYSRALSATEIQSLYKQNETTINANTNNRLTNGLVGLWSFNGNNLNMASTTAEILDMSGNNNNADNSGGRADAGRIGQGWSFDGLDDYVAAPHTASMDVTALTIAMWIKTPESLCGAGVACYRALLSKQGADRDFNLYTYSGASDGNRVTHMHMSSARFGVTMPALTTPYGPNEWHHVAFTVDASGNYVHYSDGASFASGGITAGANANSNYPIWIGRADNYYNGIIDEARVYNRALSADEIKQLYNMGK